MIKAIKLSIQVTQKQLEDALQEMNYKNTDTAIIEIEEYLA